jgi:hypothetical protein
MSGSYGETVIHPAALITTLVAGVATLLVPRRHALTPILLAGILIPMQQRIVIATMDFMMLRILVIFGWMRLLSRGEYRNFTVSTMDRLVVAWAVVGVIAYSLLWGTFNAFVNRLGVIFDVLGIYFLGRALVRNLQDARHVVKMFILVSIPLALMMLRERGEGRNAFSIFGGVPAITEIRDGRLRCQGPFEHPIMAGTFGASLLPLAMGLWFVGRGDRRWAVVGIATSATITLTTACSGPILMCLAGIIGLAMWPLRHWMQPLRWGLLVTVIMLHLIMKSPVWALLWRVKIFDASTGYHRYRLVDQFMNRVLEWGSVGVKYTSDWGVGLGDITNHYIYVATQGGLLYLGLFIAMLSLAFGAVGRALRAWSGYRKTQLFTWSLGACLFAHLVNFLGVAYFDQIIVALYLLIAMLSTVREQTMAPATARVRRRKPNAQSLALPGSLCPQSDPAGA